MTATVTDPDFNFSELDWRSFRYICNSFSEASLPQNLCWVRAASGSGTFRNLKPLVFLKSIAGTNGSRIAVQMGDILQYKLEVYSGVSLSSRLRSQRGAGSEVGAVQQYKLEVYCQYFQTSCTCWGFLHSAHRVFSLRHRALSLGGSFRYFFLFFSRSGAGKGEEASEQVAGAGLFIQNGGGGIRMRRGGVTCAVPRPSQSAIFLSELRVLLPLPLETLTAHLRTTYTSETLFMGHFSWDKTTKPMNRNQEPKKGINIKNLGGNPPLPDPPPQKHP